MLAILWSVLALLFSGAVADLGSPRWAPREAAQRSLVRYWPLTESAIRRAELSGDPEVFGRAKRVREIVAHRPRTRGLSLLCQSWTAGEVRALALLTDPHESDGLPWAKQEVWYGLDEPVTTDLESVRRKLRLLPDVTDLWGWPEHGWPWDESGGMHGLSGLRFAFRGMPEPCVYWSPEEFADARQLWAAIKAEVVPPPRPKQSPKRNRDEDR